MHGLLQDTDWMISDRDREKDIVYSAETTFETFPYTKTLVAHTKTSASHS
jgi:hypothetical protein